jgi:VanZ family protein
MRTKNILRLITAAAWVSIIAIAYATLAHVGFVYSIYYKLSPILMRPEMTTYAHLEHIIAFAVVGALFSFAYPRRTILVCCIVFGGAALLEILQTLTPDRHGTLVDALEKMAGGAAGIFLARSILQFGSGRGPQGSSGGSSGIIVTKSQQEIDGRFGRTKPNC